MKKFLSGICATALMLSFAAGSIAPVSAAPITNPKDPGFSSGILSVDYKPQWKHKNSSRDNSHNGWRDNSRRDNDRHEARNNDRKGYYHGYRGERYRRDGYREYNGMWFPLAAFAAGALVTGAIVNDNNNQRVTGGSSHVQWCYDRYRSYRASDNTFQPNYGPRQQCHSPY